MLGRQAYTYVLYNCNLWLNYEFYAVFTYSAAACTVMLEQTEEKQKKTEICAQAVEWYAFVRTSNLSPHIIH